MKISEIIVTDRDSDFDVIFRESALIAKFITASDYERYAAKDERLSRKIEVVVNKLFKKKFTKEHVYISYDWWPDHTRGIHLDTESFHQEVFDSLRALLVAQYDEWRIQAVIYQDIFKGRTMIGSIAIWSDKLLLDGALYNWMVDNKFDFGSKVAPRFVSVDPNDEDEPWATLLDDVE
ncbi:MAG: hypothetical protein JO316_10355 [Abitibacteriaceae bacterium]|nr:hypothetical protein [Abditibacteriaceae bacterium]